MTDVTEFKAAKGIAFEHEAQLLNCLKATGLELELSVNFGSRLKTEIIRITNTNFYVFRG